MGQGAATKGALHTQAGLYLHLQYARPHCRLRDGGRLRAAASTLSCTSPRPPHTTSPHTTPLRSLEELLQPEQQPGAAGGKHAALDLRRLCLVLDKYRELDRASGFAGMHRKGQAEVRAGVVG